MFMFSRSICCAKLNQLSTFETLFSNLKLRPCATPLIGPLQTCEYRIYSREKAEYANVNWDELGFALTKTDYMYVMNFTEEEQKFFNGTLTRFGNIEMCPSSGILNYGQGLFEGLKAYRKEDEGILLFRPQENALRMKMGADRMCMPSPTVDQFMDAVKKTVLANKRWGDLNLMVEDNVHRAIPGGTGGIKAVTNYSPVYKPLTEAKAKGFSDLLFLDALTGSNIEEGSACNIFILKGNVISTPTTHGTILPGITRKSIMEIASDFGYQVEERAIPIKEVFDAEEVFCTGTAMVVKSVASITYQGKRIGYKLGAETLAQKLHATLTGIQTGLIEDKLGWTMLID
uniref:Branched-chain-amino-acid aminotransferase n=1 Tax=Gossypium raimondii TaxID=29730 RepID=A0A0D2ME41_GOSRA|nr:hypothetical protein B456_002G212600 [Gossypium raimondii]